MVRFIKTLWEHKKKTIFLGGVGYYGLDLLYDRHKTFHTIRALCQESVDQGRRALPRQAKNKHITLLLNPVSANRKAKTRFEKYAEPMLHLSGFLMNVVKTERISEARDLTEIIERTNVIAVAGGDGTIFETITGLLRRDDADNATRRFPIGIIPIGMRNKFARSLAGKEYATEEEFIAESTMAIVRHKIKPHDVIQIEVVEPQNALQESTQTQVSDIDIPKNPDSDSNANQPAYIKTDESPEVKADNTAEPPIEKRKPVYSMSGITLGQFREADQIQTTMPSFFGLKFTTFWSLLRSSRPRFKAELRYTPACTGCTSCLKNESTQQSSSYLSRVFSIFRPSRPNPEVKPLVENPVCGTYDSLCVDTLEFNVRSIGEGCLEVQVGETTGGRTAFILEGLRRLKGESPNLTLKFECSQLEIVPIDSPEFCSIDYEEFEVKPLKLSVLRNKVYFFAP